MHDHKNRHDDDSNLYKIHKPPDMKQIRSLIKNLSRYSALGSNFRNFEVYIDYVSKKNNFGHAGKGPHSNLVICPQNHLDTPKN